MVVYLIFAIMFGASTTHAVPPPDGSSLKNMVLERIERVDGNFAVAFRDLSDPSNHLFINERETFHAASTMKTPVMIEVFKQAAEGNFSLSDSILVKNEFTSIVDGSTFQMNIDRDGGEGLYEYIGKRVTVRDLVGDMITVSGNLATNILIDLVDARNVMRTMQEIGATDIRVLRGVEDMKAYDRGLNNTTTAYDLLLIYEAIAHRTVLPEEACDEMIAILSDQKFRNKIPAGLPDTVVVAHKTGSITGVQHDAGIVMLPDGRAYTLVVLSKNLAGAEEGIGAIADISRLVYEWMQSVPPVIPKNEYGLEVIDDVALYVETVRGDSTKRLVDVAEFIPSIPIDMKYATTGNFTGKQLYDYPKAFLRYPAAKALRSAQREFNGMGLGLKIWDAYRPYAVTELMWEQVRDARYAANPRNGSRHNRGCAVDVTLIRLDTGDELQMPTGYDDFSERAHLDFDDLADEVLENRDLLISVMVRHGFDPLPSEWWHFDYRDWRNYELMDISFDDLQSVD
jgi:beta-lactamase class A